jgi:hypothetical protein
VTTAFLAVGVGYVDLRRQIGRVGGLAIADEARASAATSGPPNANAATESSFEAFRCQGLVSEADRALVLRREGPRVFDCQRRLAADYVGTFQIRMHVAADGTVMASQLGATPPPSPELNQCIVDVVHGIVFPPLPEGSCAVVTAPFIVGTQGDHRPPLVDE